MKEFRINEFLSVKLDKNTTLAENVKRINYMKIIISIFIIFMGFSYVFFFTPIENSSAFWWFLDFIIILFMFRWLKKNGYFTSTGKKDDEQIPKREIKGSGSILFCVLLILSLPFVTFIHELFHAYTALFYGIPVDHIRLKSLLTGDTIIGGSIPNIILTNIAIAGSVGAVIILILLLVILFVYREEINLEIYIPLYFTLSLNIFMQIYNNWCYSLLHRDGDGWAIFILNPSIIFTKMVLISFTVLFLIIIIVLTIFIFDFIDRKKASK